MSHVFTIDEYKRNGSGYLVHYIIVLAGGNKSTRTRVFKI